MMLLKHAIPENGSTEKFWSRESFWALVLWATTFLYSLIVIWGDFEGWAFVDTLLKWDDRYVGFIEVIVPLVSRYRIYMNEIDHSKNIEAMQNIYSVCWTAFAVVTAVYLFFLKARVQETRQKLRSVGLDGRTATHSVKNLAAILALFSLFVAGYGLIDTGGNNPWLDRAYSDSWHLLRPSFFLAGAFLAGATALRLHLAFREGAR
jgi:hypothetical protein